MKKTLAASKNLMQNYLAELLTEDNSADTANEEMATEALTAKQKKLDRLLQQTSVANRVLTQTVDKREQLTSPEIEQKKTPHSQPIADSELAKQPLVTAKSQGEFVTHREKKYRKGSFQAMFFDVAGLLVAVPLIELGGIHNIDKVTSLMGKPDWFKGVMLYRDDKINVVDTALWVMPEKCNKTLLSALSYQYIIMLNNSRWGMMAENLVDTVTLQQDDVKWLDNNSRRPWLAGLVKDRMCALLDVDALIKMLDDGANVNKT